MSAQSAPTAVLERKATRPRVKSVSMKDLSEIEASAARIAELTKALDAEIPVRDKLVVAARIDGYPWDRIATAAQLSRQGAQDAARRGNNNVLPVPRQRG